MIRIQTTYTDFNSVVELRRETYEGESCEIDAFPYYSETCESGYWVVECARQIERDYMLEYRNEQDFSVTVFYIIDGYSSMSDAGPYTLEWYKYLKSKYIIFSSKKSKFDAKLIFLYHTNFLLTQFF